MSDQAFDISLVINIHAGADYLARTMMSLEEAAFHARAAGLTTETLFVMDRSPPETLAWVRRYVNSVFHAVRVLEVDNGSLGLSRDVGLREARGEYVMYADEDDLISYNSITAFHALARSLGPGAILVPRYLFGFGTFHLLAEYRGTDEVSPLSLIKYHPYVSRLFLHRSAGDRLGYVDVRLTKGYAYEDWHFNATAIARGFSFASPPETILFYRHRAGLLSNMNSLSVRQIPPTELFEPRTYLATCETAFRAFTEGRAVQVDPEEARRSFQQSAACQVMTHAANQIEPAITWEHVTDAPVLPNTAGDLRLGAAYFRACRIVGWQSFTDVALVPAQPSSRALDRLNGIVSGVAAIDPNCRWLVIVGDGESQPDQRFFDLPQATIVDLSDIGSGLPPADLDVLTLRLIENAGSAPRLHLFGADHVYRFFGNYRNVLGAAAAIYYRNPDLFSREGALPFELGKNFDFISENLHALTIVVTDSERLERRDRKRLDRQALPWRRLPPLPNNLGKPQIRSGRSMRVAWVDDECDAGNLSCVEAVGRWLQENGSNAGIDVLLRSSQTVAGTLPSNVALVECGHEPRGAGQDYPALVWRGASWGAPAEVIDALASGVPVIALDTESAGEFIRDEETGLLLDGHAACMAAYGEAILNIVNDPSKRARLSDQAREWAEQRCSEAAFRACLRDVLDVVASSRQSKPAMS